MRRTSGALSDARFVREHCPLVEFGLVGKNMLQVDERVAVDQTYQLKAIYGRSCGTISREDRGHTATSPPANACAGWSSSTSRGVEADEVDGLDPMRSISGPSTATGPSARHGSAERPVGKIGRVCVLPRRGALALVPALIRAALEVLRAQPVISDAYLGSQSHATVFYEKLGFAVEGVEFQDAGIPHRHMRRAL